VKRFTAILFSVLLVWMQIAPAPVSASTVCVKAAMGNCADCCGRVDCCAAKPASNSQRVPAVTTQAGAQNQILSPAVVAWTLPKNPAGSISPASASPLMVMATPLYERNCALLL
jgi:hypothetical protein